jgi:anthranilate synthase component 1
MSQEKIDEYFKQGFNHIPVFRIVDALDDNALLIYQKFVNNSKGTYSYLFESSHDSGKKWGRYSIIGLKADIVIKVFDFCIKRYQDKQLVETISKVENPLDWVENYLQEFKVPEIDNLPDFHGGLVGYFGYESVRYIEPSLLDGLNKNAPNSLDIADILLMVSNDLVVLDREQKKLFLITHINKDKSYQEAQSVLDLMEANLLNEVAIPSIKNALKMSAFKSEFGQEKYKKCVETVRDYIIKGDVMQVVPSQRLVADFEDEPIALYQVLTKLNPSPYMYFLNLDDTFVVGSSPEILTRVENNKATVRPLAGTRKRGKTEEEDIALEKELLKDEKEIAEHLMLIDLGRNDLGRVAKIGSVKVTDVMSIERYSHVMHIVSNVECELQENITAMDVFKATFPAGTLSGAPKVRAMEIINELEPNKRNIYSGAIGYLSWNGNMDLAIAIRTGIINGKKLFVQAGAGVVYDSDPELEWQETMQKAKAVMRAATL